MRDIHLSEAAKSDLVDIWVETDRQWGGAAQADRYLDDIERALKGGLIANPQMGGSDCSDLLQVRVN